MTGTMTEAAPATRELDPVASAELLASMAQRRVPISLRAETPGPELCWSGCLIDSVPSRLHVQIHPIDSIDSIDSGQRAMPASQALTATLTDGEARYSFRTRCLPNATPASAGKIELDRPRAITLFERRRSPRRRFQASCRVSLSARVIGTNWECTASLLNLSPDGMACRVGREAIAPISQGQPITVAFALDGAPDGFIFNGNVVSKTGTPSPDQIVLGVAFLHDDQSSGARTRLEAALTAP